MVTDADLSHIAEPLRHLAVPIDSLTLDPSNARKHDERNLASCRERSNRRLGEYVNCLHCRGAFYRRKSESTRRFCSAACANTHKTRYPKSQRLCAVCGGIFLANDKPFSNSKGRYCSLPCRNKGYLGMYHGAAAHGHRGHRPGWRSIAQRHLAQDNRFCVLCGAGTGRRLSVHHIEPYRVAHNNDTLNLVTACSECHPRLERISDRIAVLPADLRTIAVAIVGAHLDDWWCVHQGRRLIQEAS
jgi:hypothetical protein